ncbi:hypothetical protein RUND412_009949 [Rhizina undulata]
MTTSPPVTSAPASPASTPEIDRVTYSLIRRVLCAHSPPTTPLESLLPALTSSAEVDVELYAFLAIICRDFIYSWYSQITTDNGFVDEVIAVVAHCTRSIEERLRKVDLEVLLLDEIPALLNHHVQDYRSALARHDTALSPHMSLSEIFHNFQPHPALDQLPTTEKLYLKLLSSGILSVLLPTEDLDSDCERSIIREILANVVLWNIVDRLSEPYIIYDIITKLLQPTPPKDPNSRTSRRRSASKRNGAETKAAAINTQETIEEIPMPSKRSKFTINFRLPSIPTAKILSILDTVFGFLFTALSLLTSLLASIISLMHNPPPPPLRTKPILQMSIFPTISSFLHIPTFHPWLFGNLRLLSKPFQSRSSTPGSLLDDLLSRSFREKILSPTTLITALRLSRAALFPGNAQAPAKPVPSIKEQARIRKACEEAVLDAIPEVVKKMYFGSASGSDGGMEIGREERLRVVGREYLDVFGNHRINRHLVLNLLDLIVGRVLPELLDEGPGELRGARVGGLA